MLLHVATTSHGSVALAHTQHGDIVGQIVLAPAEAPAEDWWRELPGVYELSLETSREWRRMGVARGLLEFCVGATWMEHIIVLAMGLDWHWDLEGTGLEVSGYRNVLRRLFESAGFRVVRTAEPNVAMHASNVLLVRVGGQVAADRRAASQEALFSPPWQRERIPI